MSISEYKIEARDISKAFVVNKDYIEVLRNISLGVRPNEFLVILGPGQSGKTTLINCMSGIMAPDSGDIFLNGEIVTEAGPARGVVFQQYALFPWKSVLENVAFGLTIRGVDKKERREVAQHYIDLVGLQGFEKAYPHHLSGGMRQRVSIARAYASDPEVLFMDEPFSALDAQTRYAMEQDILRITEQEKKTIIFITNNVEEAIYLGDRIILLTSLPGRIKRVFPVEMVKPRDYTDARFLDLRLAISEDTELILDA